MTENNNIGTGYVMLVC